MTKTNETIGYVPYPQTGLISLDEKRDAVRTPEYVRYTAKDTLGILQRCCEEK